MIGKTVAFSNEDVMKINVIKRLMREKMKHFDELLPRFITEYLKEGIIAGGAFASMWHHEEPNDWDFYFNDSSAMLKFQSLMNDTIPSSVPINYDMNPGAVTFECGLQIITKWTANHRVYFDFIHCLPYYDYNKDELYISPQQLDSIKRKELIKNPILKSTPTVTRVEKFLDRGWTISTKVIPSPIPTADYLAEGDLRVCADGRIEVFANGQWICP